MSLLMKYSWNDPRPNWLETEHIQVAICTALAQHPDYSNKFLFAARINEGKRSKRMAAMLKMAGLTAGEPDLDIWLDQGRSMRIELKRAKGRLSPVQKKRHAELARIGHAVYTLYCATPQDGIDQVLELLEEWL